MNQDPGIFKRCCKAMNPNPLGDYRGSGVEDSEVGLTFQKSLRGSRSVFMGCLGCGPGSLWEGSRASLRASVKEEFWIAGSCRCFDCIEVLRGSWILCPDSFCCGYCRILCGPWDITAVPQRVLVIMGWQGSLGVWIFLYETIDNLFCTYMGFHKYLWRSQDSFMMI